jgi:hypothetical protein
MLEKVARYKIIVSHVSALARCRQDDDVFTSHVSDAGPDGAADVPRPYGPEALQLHTMWAHDGGMNGVCINFLWELDQEKDSPQAFSILKQD